MAKLDDAPVIPTRTVAQLPVFFEPRSTDEYVPLRFTEIDHKRHTRVLEALERSAKVFHRPPTLLASSEVGTAIGLRAINQEADDDFYLVPQEAESDIDCIAEVFAGPRAVIDVQTHYRSDHSSSGRDALIALYQPVLPKWWHELERVGLWSLAEYLEKVFLRSRTTVAVLTSGPGLDAGRYLYNDELAATRQLVESFGANGRLLNQAVVHPNVEAELNAMPEWAERYRPAGWKTYTLGVRDRVQRRWVSGWMLDDEIGQRFLEAVRASGIRVLCTHKGISELAAAGSPSDIGPAARENPDISFVVYHSGFEMPYTAEAIEGPYETATADKGVNRLITSLRAAGIRPGANVYAELGSTWFAVIRDPRAAAHVLGKLLLAVGEDNVIWGTDGIWYGPAQPLVDAFWVFQIPAEMREEFGYPELTAEIKNKILFENAARVYGIDIDKAIASEATDELAWVRRAIAEYERSGTPGKRP